MGSFEYRRGGGFNIAGKEGINADPPQSFRYISWVAVKELNSSYYDGETLLITVYTHYGNLV